MAHSNTGFHLQDPTTPQRPCPAARGRAGLCGLAVGDRRWWCGVFAALLVVSLFPLEGRAEDDGRFWMEKGSRKTASIHKPGVFREMVESVGSAVVNIEVSIKRRGAFSGEKSEVGQGSGFIITADGYALTNNHVVADAVEIVVLLADDRRFSARVIGADESTDVALIKLDGAAGLPALALGSSQGMGVGDWVVAIGSPLGLRSSVTAGIVSAMGRRDVKPGEGRFYSNFIQTDASINPGNSGGPLVNMSGEVIGINTAINRLGQGIGFAIPIDMVKSILPALRSDGFVERSWMGISIQEIDGPLASTFGLKKAGGALVTQVDPRGPAFRAGVREGDIILAFDSESIQTSEELPWLASVAGVGRTVELAVWRSGGRQSVKMTLEAMPNQRRSRPTLDEPLKSPVSADLGIEVRVGGDSGVFVAVIADDSPARASDLRPGDVIVQVGDASVTSINDFYKFLKAAPAVVRLKVQRLGATRYVALPTR